MKKNRSKKSWVLGAGLLVMACVIVWGLAVNYQTGLAAMIRQRIVWPSACRVMTNMYQDCDVNSYPESLTPQTICGTGPFTSVFHAPDGFVRAIYYYKDRIGNSWVPRSAVAKDKRGNLMIDKNPSCSYF